MQEYRIYHAAGLCGYMEIESQPRKLVGIVKADSLNDAFKKSQNFDDHWNPENPCRSTSVGDVIQFDNESYIVAGMGFRLLSIDKPKLQDDEEEDTEFTKQVQSAFQQIERNRIKTKLLEQCIQETKT